MKANKAAFECGELAQRMAQGYYAHMTAIEIGSDPRAMALGPKIQPGFMVPIGTVQRKDGTEHGFHYQYYLEQVRTNPALQDELSRVWLTGALLKVDDGVSDLRKANKDLYRVPELELLWHLRNGIAHGNRFRIDKPKKLNEFPAHNKFAWVKSDTKAEFEITLALQCQKVLFDFMGPADVLDLLMSVGVYLIRMGNGDPLRL